MYWVRLSHRFQGISCDTLGWLQCFLRLVLILSVGKHTHSGLLPWVIHGSRPATMGTIITKGFQASAEVLRAGLCQVPHSDTHAWKHGRHSTDLLTLGLLETVTNFRSCLDYVPVYSMMPTEGVGIFNVMFSAIKWKLIEQTSPINSPCLPIVGSECQYYCFIHPYPTSTQMKSVDNSEL